MRHYEVPWFAEFFNSWPHVNLSFQEISSNFEPESSSYRESLSVWAFVPILWMALTMIGLVVFSCYRCCCMVDKGKKRPVTCLRWSIAILAIVTCGAIGLGFYGNELGNQGVQQFTEATENSQHTLQSIQKQLRDVQGNPNISSGVMGLMNLFTNDTTYLKEKDENLRTELKTLTGKVRDQSSSVSRDVRDIEQQVRLVELTGVAEPLEQYEYFRWVAIIAFLCWQLVVCLLILMGLGLGSRCLLITCAVLCGFTMVIVFITGGVYLGSSVGISDLCVSPATFVAKRGPELNPGTLEYYIYCNGTSPFSGGLKNAMDGVTQANKTLSRLLSKAYNVFSKHEDEGYKTLDEVEGSIASLVEVYGELYQLEGHANRIRSGLQKYVNRLQMLTAQTDCSRIHGDYLDAVDGVCYMALPGVAFLLLSALIIGLLLTILVVMTTVAAARISKRKGYYEIDENDPYMPRADTTSPTYFSPIELGNVGNRYSRNGPGPAAPAGDHMAMERRSSPPPAYGEFSQDEQPDMEGEASDRRTTNSFRRDANHASRVGGTQPRSLPVS